MKYIHILLIVFVAGLLRFYQLGVNPPSLDWDEVSLAYSAQSLLETGADEYGNTYPLTIRSFNDYKPPLYVYLLMPSLFFFGKSDFAIRLPSAFFGTVTVLLVYFLVIEIFSNKKNNKLYNVRVVLAVLVAFFLAISPWHLHFSRVAFEANLGLTFLVGGVLAYLKARQQSWWLVVSAASFGLSMVSYHSTKLIIPLFILCTVWPYLNQFLKNRKVVIFSAIISLVFLGLIGKTIYQGVGQSRFNSVSFLTTDNLFDKSRFRIEQDNFSLGSRLINHRFVIYFKEILGGYLDHFTVKFLFLDGDSIPRSTSAMSMGVLYLWTLPFVLIGAVWLLSQSNEARKLIFSWFLVAPSASALTSGTPNSVRSIFFLPTFQIFTAVGVLVVYKWIRQIRRQLFFLGFITYFIFSVLGVMFYFHMYYVHAPLEHSQGWQYGYREMVQWVMGQKDKYDKVIVTTVYDQPYIYFLWYGNYSSINIINDGELYKGIDNIEFRKVEWLEDRKLANTLVIVSPEEVKEHVDPVWQVNFLDGVPAFLAFSFDGV